MLDRQLIRRAARIFVKSAVTVKDREPLYRRPVSGILGRASSPLTAVALGSIAPFKANPTASWGERFIAAYSKNIEKAQRREEARKAKETGEEVKPVGSSDELEVQYGSSRPLSNLARIWRRKRLGVGGKLVGTLTWPINEAMIALTRGDSYNPFSNTVASFHKDPAIIAHELGHAEDFGKRKYKSLYALGRMLPFSPFKYLQESLASSSAIRRLKRLGYSDDDITRANRVLSGGLGSYAGADLGVTPILAALAGQAVGRTSKPFGTGSDVKVMPEYRKNVAKSKKTTKKEKRKEDDRKSSAKTRKAASLSVLADDRFYSGLVETYIAKCCS